MMEKQKHSLVLCCLIGEQDQPGKRGLLIRGGGAGIIIIMMIKLLSWFQGEKQQTIVFQECIKVMM